MGDAGVFVRSRAGRHSGFGVRGWEMSLGSVRRRLEWVWGVGVEVDSMVACARDMLCVCTICTYWFE